MNALYREAGRDETSARPLRRGDDVDGIAIGGFGAAVTSDHAARESLGDFAGDEHVDAPDTPMNLERETDAIRDVGDSV